MAEEEYAEVEVPGRENDEAAEIRDTDIVFDCPHCGKSLVIDYRGAGLQINCSECGESVLVPIPIRGTLKRCIITSPKMKVKRKRRRNLS